MDDHAAAGVPVASAAGRWLIAAAVLGSGVAFLDGTVVNVALPALARDLDTGIGGQQWVVDGYLLPLSALLLTGGALGDVFGRRPVFVIGLAVFAAGSVGCGLAPTIGWLIAARVVQRVGSISPAPWPSPWVSPESCSR